MYIFFYCLSYNHQQLIIRIPAATRNTFRRRQWCTVANLREAAASRPAKFASRPPKNRLK